MNVLRIVWTNRKSIVATVQFLAIPFLVLVCFNFYSITPGNVARLLKQIITENWLIYLVLGAVYILLSLLRWLIICFTIDVKISSMRLAENFLRCNFLNYVLPTSSSGDVIRILLMHERGISMGLASSCVIFEKFLGVSTLIILALMTLVFQGRVNEGLVAYTIYGFSFALCAALLFIVIIPIFSKNTRLLELIAYLRKINYSVRIIVLHWLLATLIHLPILILVFISLKSGGTLEASFIYVAPMIASGLLLMLLPLSYGGHGLREGAFLLVFVPLGIETELVFAIAVLLGLLLIIYAISGYILLTLVKLINKTKIAGTR